MNEPATPTGFGLIIIGTEILDGRREDQHFAVCRDLLTKRHIPLTYAFILPDQPHLLTEQIGWAMARTEPFFCCGGIGSTPDDYTRACAAEAAGLKMALHPEGVQILKTHYGKEATPPRLEMVRFPEGAALIPNPVNEVPGFGIRNGYFLPGFPEMAAPMMEWVLDAYYLPGEVRAVHALVLKGCREADLVDLMCTFMAAHPRVSFSSLPRFSELELGISGPVKEAKAARADLVSRLKALEIVFTAAPTRSG